ncbi:MAG: hypothetical protein JXR07_03795 [Reichenbachiella sp.]
MKIIWYNPDQKKYKYGNIEDFNNELVEAENIEAYTVLMKFNKNSSSLANKVMKQLNIMNDSTKSHMFL